MTKWRHSNSRQWAKWAGLCACVLTAGCGDELESPDIVKTLRVLGVQKDHPYSAPTIDPANPSKVELTMLSHDGARAYAQTPRGIQRLWFSGCDDLPGDLYFNCFARMAGLWKLYSASHADTQWQGDVSWSPVDDLSDGLSSDERNATLAPLLAQLNPELPVELAEGYLKTYRIGSGERFTYPVPPRIIESHRSSSDPTIPAYGHAFVFYVACAGHIDLNPTWANASVSDSLYHATLGFPFLCLDDQRVALSPDDFVAGYTQVFVYGDGSANHNPIIDGVNFAGQKQSAAAYCLDGDCVPYASTSICDAPNVPHVPACKSECPEYPFLPTLDPEQNNDADLFLSAAGKPTGEQMWIDYYADRGAFTNHTRNLRDATLGWFFDHATKWKAPAEPGPVNLWAVVHDNRGGTGWLRLSVCVD